MNFNELRGCFRSLLDSGISVELISPPGRGKSTFINDAVARESAADGEEWGLSTLFLATQTPPDLIGYIMKGERDFGNGAVAVSEPTMPGWMITRSGKPVHAYKRGILFLDEYGQGEADVKRASAELLLNRQLGPWRLPDGWSVIAASNRSNDRSGVTKSFDFVINRRIEINITDDITAWEAWALENSVDPLAVSFAVQNPHIVFSDGVPEKQGPWCTPRSLVMLMTALDRMRDSDGKLVISGVTHEISAGMIGKAATAQLMAHIKLGHELPDFDDIVSKPEKVKVPSKPDAQMIVAYSVAARVSKDTLPPVLTYMGKLPKEFLVTFANATIKRDPSLLSAPAMLKFCQDHQAVLRAIQ